MKSSCSFNFDYLKGANLISLRANVAVSTLGNRWESHPPPTNLRSLRSRHASHGAVALDPGIGGSVACGAAGGG